MTEITPPSSLFLQGRSVTPADLLHIQTLLTAEPRLNRRRISIQLAEHWNWRTATGQIKDMAARTLLLKLHHRHLIVLPPPRHTSSRRSSEKTLPLFDDPLPHPIEGPLAPLMPIQLHVVKAGHSAWKQLAGHLRRHHYLGFSGFVGENIAYRAQDRHGRDLACLLFGAAAWKTKPRDQWIGWTDAGRQRRLSLVVNNSRFLILPWVRVPHLASHLLARISRRLSEDWHRHYGHPVYLAETFVEQNRFKGTCYKAANWIFVGQTAGRSRQDRWNTLRVPIKDIYLYPLTFNAREILRHDGP